MEQSFASSLHLTPPLAPLEAVRAYAKNQDESASLDDIIAEGDIVNYQGDVPGKYALWSAMKRVRESTQPHGYPTSKHSSCGRHKVLSDKPMRVIVSFVKTWRHKRFCTCDQVVLDGVTLTMPPKPLHDRQKHAAQRISSMWLKHGGAPRQRYTHVQSLWDPIGNQGSVVGRLFGQRQVHPPSLDLKAPNDD